MRPYILQTAYVLVASSGLLLAWILVNKPWRKASDEIDVASDATATDEDPHHDTEDRQES